MKMNSKLELFGLGDELQQWSQLMWYHCSSMHCIDCYQPAFLKPVDCDCYRYGENHTFVRKSCLID